MIWNVKQKAKVRTLVLQVREILVNEGLNILPINAVKYIRTASIYGKCRKYGTVAADIYISAMCLENDTVLINTVIHEICHAIPYSKGHDELWKNAAKKAGEIFKVEITEEGTQEEYKLVKGYIEKQYKYAIVCPCCGILKKAKTANNKVIKNPQKYKCGKCGSDLYIKNIVEG